MKPDLSFAIPAYNDEQTIGAVVEDCDAVAKKLKTSYEIVVINDCSSDGTEKRLTTLQKKFSALRFFSHEKNKGYAVTLKELWYECAGERIYHLPGDNQIPADQLMPLWQEKTSADIIIGWRKDRQDGQYRDFQARVYNTLLSLFFSEFRASQIHDVDSVKLIKSEILQKIPLKATSAFVDAELVIKALRKDVFIKEIPIGHKKRAQGSGGGARISVILPTIVDMLRMKLQFL